MPQKIKNNNQIVIQKAISSQEKNTIPISKNI